MQRIRPLGEKSLTDLSKLVIDVLLPFYMFYTTARTASIDALLQAPIVLIAGFLIPLSGLLAAPLFFKPLRVGQNRKDVFRFSLMLANTGFLGFPICEALFGTTGAFYAVIYDFGLTMIGFTFGIWLLNGGRFSNWKTLMFNPLLISVLLGLLASLTSFQFPPWMMKPLAAIGQGTLPIALLVAGAQIGNIRFNKDAFQLDLVGVIVLRLIATPAFVYVLLLLIGDIGLSEKVIIMQAAMPVAVATTIMAKRYQNDADFTASATLFSTLFSMITLPLLALLLIR